MSYVATKRAGGGGGVVTYAAKASDATAAAAEVSRVCLLYQVCRLSFAALLWPSGTVVFGLFGVCQSNTSVGDFDSEFSYGRFFSGMKKNSRGGSDLVVSVAVRACLVDRGEIFSQS